ncbi:MAG: hypothetical protein EXR98_19585 [Gemmataceae bacterium]|nr:hypothetical protein [Gemmataceae bacterium]
MRLFRYALIAVLFVILGVAVYQTLLWFGVWGNPNEAQVKSLEDEDQEIAFIEPATSTDDWSRLVTAVKLVQQDWPRINPSLPRLKISLDDAFPSLTAAVPEIVLSLSTSGHQRLRLRWYKISGEHDAASWIRKLNARAHPPLAIVGGATSDRALRVARALQATYPDPDQPAPMFLITTATAEKTAEETPLIEEYPKRSFRFSFTNQRMVEAILKFVQQTPNLWVHKTADPQTLAGAVASMIGAADPLHELAVFGSFLDLRPPSYTMHAVYWEDERYSKDLTDLFRKEFEKRYPAGRFNDQGGIAYGVGDFSSPAPLEQSAVGTFLAEPIAPHSFLVLPTQTVRMRRFLINLRQSPLDARNLVVLNGDAISFHSVFRDRDVVWNIVDLPYSLVFFAHRNPIERAAGFTDSKKGRQDAADVFPQRTTTGTHDILLYRDVLEAILYAAYDQGRLLGDSLEVRKRLQATAWYQPPIETAKEDFARVCNPRVHTLDPKVRTFFSKKGDRKRDTGEHIVWVKPSFTEDRVDRTSTISVWSMIPNTKGDVWQVVKPSPFPVDYNLSR